MEKRISKVKQEDFVSFFTVDAIVFLRNQRARFQLEIRNEEKERNECWLRITFRGLSNPRKGETRSISFFIEARRTLGWIISPKGEIPCYRGMQCRFVFAGGLISREGFSQAA